MLVNERSKRELVQSWK